MTILGNAILMTSPKGRHNWFS